VLPSQVTCKWCTESNWLSQRFGCSLRVLRVEMPWICGLNGSTAGGESSQLWFLQEKRYTRNTLKLFCRRQCYWEYFKLKLNIISEILQNRVDKMVLCTER
jgi:hypothetical protein